MSKFGLESVWRLVFCPKPAVAKKEQCVAIAFGKVPQGTSAMGRHPQNVVVIPCLKAIKDLSLGLSVTWLIQGQQDNSMSLPSLLTEFGELLSMVSGLHGAPQFWETHSYPNAFLSHPKSTTSTSFSCRKRLLAWYPRQAPEQLSGHLPFGLCLTISTGRVDEHVKFPWRWARSVALTRYIPGPGFDLFQGFLRMWQLCWCWSHRPSLMNESFLQTTNYAFHSRCGWECGSSMSSRCNMLNCGCFRGKYLDLSCAFCKIWAPPNPPNWSMAVNTWLWVEYGWNM